MGRRTREQAFETSDGTKVSEGHHWVSWERQHERNLKRECPTLPVFHQQHRTSPETADLPPICHHQERRNEKKELAQQVVSMLFS